MNITTVLKSVNYDNDRMKFFDINADDLNFKDVKLKGVTLESSVYSAVLCYFDVATSEVYYCYASLEGEDYYFLSKEYVNEDNVIYTDEKLMLEIVQKVLGADIDVYVDLEMDEFTLTKVDESAARLDITRNAMLHKFINQYVKEVVTE